MSSIVRIVCGNTYEDVTANINIKSQYRLEVVTPEEFMKLPTSNDVNYYVIIDNGFNVRRYISSNGNIYKIIHEI